MIMHWLESGCLQIFRTLQNLTIPGEVSFLSFQYGSQFGQPCKSAKVFFSYFNDLLLNIFAVNLFLGIFTRIKYLDDFL